MISLEKDGRTSYCRILYKFINSITLTSSGVLKKTDLVSPTRETEPARRNTRTRVVLVRVVRTARRTERETRRRL